MINQFRYKFNINISHSIESDKVNGNIHAHNISIAIFVIDNEDEFILYDDIEAEIREYIDSYSGKYINEIKPFDSIVPTIENIGIVFYEDLKRKLENNNYIMTKLELSDMPTRTYIIKG